MSLEQGSKTAVRTCMGIKQKDKITILSDEGSKSIGQALQEEAVKITRDIHFFNMEDFGDRPLGFFPEEIKESAKRSTATFWTAKAFEDELNSVRMPFCRTAIEGGRHAHMVGITEKVFTTGLSGDYVEIARFTEKVKDILDSVDTIRIRTERGTDLKAKVGKYKWVASTGLVRKIGTWHNLPDGEVFTAPYRMEGTAVIDGTLGDYLDNLYKPGHTEKYPLKLEIENKERPVLVKIECEDKKLEKEFRNYVDKGKNSRFIGELGFGTNLLCKSLMGNMLIDEKFPGIHIAPGDPIGSLTGAEWESSTHIDLIIKKCNVWAGEQQIMENGKYLIDEFD